MIRFVLVLALCTSWVFPEDKADTVSGAPRDAAGDTLELIRLATEAGHAYARRDLPTLERMTADDYVQTDVRGGVLNRSQWLEFVKNRKSDLTVDTDNVQVSIYGTTAVVRGHWTYKRNVDSKEATSYSQWTSVWTRCGDNWKRHAFQNTYVNAKADVYAYADAQQETPLAAAPTYSIDSSHLPAQMLTIAHVLAGTWSITWTEPDGHVIGTGEEVWKAVPGGSALVEENRSTVNGKPADDFAAMWWDGKAQKVHGIWCDAILNDEGCSGFIVTLEGADVVLSGEWEYQAKRQAWREILTRTNAGMTQTLYIGEPGKELRLASTIRGTRR